MLGAVIGITVALHPGHGAVTTVSTPGQQQRPAPTAVPTTPAQPTSPPTFGRSRPRSRVVFPLGVWNQTPEVNAQNYARIGINQFVGLYSGPSPGSLAALALARLHVVTDGQSPAVLADAHARVIGAWLQPDEPDNAQPRADGS